MSYLPADEYGRSFYDESPTYTVMLVHGRYQVSKTRWYRSGDESDCEITVIENFDTLDQAQEFASRLALGH